MTLTSFGLNSHAVLAQSGAAVTIRDSTFITVDGAAGIRSDRGGSSVVATNLDISTLGTGGHGLNATGGTIFASGTSILTGGVGHGMTLSANAGVGTITFQNGDVATGVLLGSDPTTATFGKPVDADGALVAAPDQYVASGAPVTGFSPSRRAAGFGSTSILRPRRRPAAPAAS